jgi:ATP-dependent protease ClpP protease subunit
MKFLSLFVLLITVFAQKQNVIELNSRNLITFRGSIKGSSVTTWISQINEHDSESTTLYIYLSSPGGSVLEGNKLVDQIKMLESNGINVICIADFAASMAFVILQACPKRVALSSSVLMQHQMSLSLDGPLENINNYLSFIHQINENLETMQASRLNMSTTDFKMKVMNDWWISGYNAIKENVVDELVLVKCTKDIVKKTEVIIVNTFFGLVELIFSKCPIGREPLEIRFHNLNNITIDIENEIKNYVPSLYMKYYSLRKHF